MTSGGGGCGLGDCGFTNGDDARFRFRLARLSPGRDCPRSAGDGLKSGIVGADSRRAFLAAMEGDVVTDDAGCLGEPAEECLGEGGVVVLTEAALASPGARGLALFSTGCVEAAAGDEGLRGWM